MTRSPMILSKPLDPFEVTRQVALVFGVEALAPLMGRAAGTLYNKLNGNESSHHQLTLADFIQVNVLTHDYAPLRALNYALGHCCYPVPDCSQVSDTALMELLNNIGSEGGDFYRVLNIALADKMFSREDYLKVRQEAMDFMGAIGEALRRIEGLVDD